MLRLATRFGGVARLATFRRSRNVSAPPPPPPPASTWDVTPAPSFTQGAGQTYDVASTGPVALGYTAGGTYDVASGTLPASMSLSTAGVLTDGGAAAGTATVTFGYNEPGALPMFTLHSGNVSGTLPWMGTVYPAEGAVPSGMSLSSPDDTSMRSSVLSTWPDGSAQVMVVAGHKAGILANSTTTVRVRPAIVSDTPLTTTDIASKFTTGIAFANFGGGTQTLNSWGSPDRIWWANSQVICARYRQSLNVGVMEAVIDVHAFANGRAFVEVVIENSSLAPAAPVSPALQTYTGATVGVNGTTIATVSSSAGVNAVHQPFRAWYCSGWIGGDPSIEVTHDTASMWAHPILYRPTTASSVDLQTTYQNDTYTPWSTGRQRSPGMGGGADHPSIGPLTTWDAHYLQSGNRYARRAVIASGLAALTFNINYRDSGRDSGTNTVPTFTQLAGKTIQFNFPSVSGNGDTANWEVAHHPAVGLMAFLCRPSPCFIEIAQKVAVWNGLYDYSGTGRFTYFYQTRGKAWAFRSLAHSIFVTPDVHGWKAPAKTSLTTNVTFLRNWDASPEDKLNVMWENSVPGAETNQGYWYYDHSGGGSPTPDGVPFQQSIWMHHFLCPELFKAHEAKLLTGADQASLAALVDWALLQPVRWINEQPNGGWRYIGYRTTIGTADGSQSVTIGQLDDWGAMRAYRNPTNPATVSGTWFTNGGNDPVSYATGWQVENGNSGAIYVAPFWMSLCAAVERGVSGAEAAWNVVNANVTNLTTFKNHGAIDPRHHSYPRNK